MAASHDLNFGLEQSQHASIDLVHSYPTQSLNSSSKVSYLSGTSQAFTLSDTSVVVRLWALVSKVQAQGV